MDGIFREIRIERENQDKKWGQQDHKNGTGNRWGAWADQARRDCNDAFQSVSG